VSGSNIETQVDREQDYTIYTVHGDFTADQIGRAIQIFFDGNMTTLTLWDFTDAEFGNISGAIPQQVAGLSQQFEGKRVPGAKTAMVFTKDVGYGLGRMFEMFRELQDSQTDYRTFRSRAEALRWLGIEPAD
jgi:hypothetical protein